MIGLIPVVSGSSDNVIFEQIGTLSGATSYLHAHVTINISSIESQYRLYREFLQSEIHRTQMEAENVILTDAPNLGIEMNQTTFNELQDKPENSSMTPTEEAVWQLVEELIMNPNVTKREVVGLLVKSYRFPLIQNITDRYEIISSKEYLFRTRTLGQDETEAMEDVIQKYYSVLAHKAQMEVLRLNKQIWHKITLLHWNDLLDIGLHLATFKEFLPPVFTGTSHRVISTEYVENLKPHSQNVVYDDSYYETQFFQAEATRGARKFRRSYATSWNHQDLNDTTWPFGTRDPSPPDRPNFRNDFPNLAAREKRFVAGAASLAGATAVTGLGMYSSVQMEFLKQQLVEIKGNTRKLFEVADIHELQFQQLEAGVRHLSSQLLTDLKTNPGLYDSRLTRIENHLRDQLRSVTHALQAAQYNRLAVDYLSPNLVRRLFPRLEVTAQDLGCRLLTQFSSDLYQLDTSLLYDGMNAHLLLHVPMVPTQSLLRLFRLHPFPIPFFDEHFLIPNVKNDIVAISNTSPRLHVQFTSADLNGCRKLGSTFLCDQFGVLFRNFNATCMGALYDQKFTLARQLCDFHVEPIKERIHSLRNNKFIVYLTEAFTVPLSCRGNHGGSEAREKHLGAGVQRFQLPPGCIARFRDHMVYSDMTIKMPADTLHFEWAWSTAHLFNQSSTEVMIEIMQLQRFGLYQPSLASLGLVMSTTLSTWVSNVKTTLVVLIAILGFTTFFVVLNCYRHFRRLPGNEEENYGRDTPPFGLRDHNETLDPTDNDESVPINPISNVNSSGDGSPMTNQPVPPPPQGTPEWTPPAYDTFHRQIMTRTRSGHVYCINLPRPPDRPEENEVSRKNSSWTTT